MSKQVNRREVLRAAGIAGVGAMLGTAHAAAREAVDRGGGSIPPQAEGETPSTTAEMVAFYGPHQAGIATLPQQHLYLAAFDVLVSTQADLQNVLKLWSDAAARMCAGELVSEEVEDSRLPPIDSGEAVDHGPARLTITFGFGPTLFLRDGVDRFGLLARRPDQLVDLPSLPGDALDLARSAGDLCIQACADDQQVAFHAVRNLTRLAKGIVQPRWMQLGSGAGVGSARTPSRPRNLFGFKEGTNNLDVMDDQAMRQHIWVGADTEPAWMRNGSYMVLRRIRMLLDQWDNSSLDDQERSIGRHRVSGAALGKQQEFDAVDLDAKGPDAQVLIPMNAHIRVAVAGGERILRRGYSYVDGVDAASGQIDAGRLFISFQREPQKQIVPMLQRLAANDALNEYTTHTGSAIFACPGGAEPGSYVGQSLFEY